MAGNYPAGVTDADFCDELWEPEPSDEDFEGEYLERIEDEAAQLPPYDFTAEFAGELVWTDQDIAEYEAWLVGDEDARRAA